MSSKRRRAYKKYNWRQHSVWLIGRQHREIFDESRSKYIELALLYGVDKIEVKCELVPLKAGMWTIVVPVAVPYLKGSVQ